MFIAFLLSESGNDLINEADLFFFFFLCMFIILILSHDDNHLEKDGKNHIRVCSFHLCKTKVQLMVSYDFENTFSFIKESDNEYL